MRCLALARLLLFALLGAFASGAFAAVSENFTTTPVPSTFQLVSAARVTTAGTFRSSPASLRILAVGATVPYVTYVGADGQGKDDGIARFSFWYRRYDTVANSAFVVEYSRDGGDWTQIGAQVTPSSTTYAEWSTDGQPGFPMYGDNIRVRLRGVGINCRLYIDDLAITDSPIPAGAPDGTFTPQQAIFPPALAGATSTLTIAIANGAGPAVTQDLVISTTTPLTISGAGASHFSVVSVSDSVLSPGETANIELAYTGNDQQQHSATATLNCNDYIPPTIALSAYNYADVPNLAAARATAEGLFVRVTGSSIATLATNGITTGTNQFYLQDASGADGQTGLRIDDPGYNAGTQTEAGREVWDVYGQILTIDGMKTLQLAHAYAWPGTPADPGDIPAPLVLTGGEDFEGIEGELVSLGGTFFEGDGAWQAATAYPLGAPQGGPIDEIFVGETSLLAGETIPPFDAPKTVTGLAGQSGSIAQLLPRYPADVTAGASQPAQIALSSPAGVNFGDREILLGRKAHTITLQNAGSGPLVWTGAGLAFSGPQAAAFSAWPTTATLNVVWPGTTASLTLYMNPDTTGAQQGVATFTTNATNAPSLALNLLGQGTQPQPGDWAQYGGGSGAQGEHRGRQFVDATVKRFDTPIWQTGAEGLYSGAAPCVLEDPNAPVPVRVYAWGSDDTSYDATYAFVKCFNGDTGALLWTSDPITDLSFTIGYDSWHSMAADKASNRVFLGMGAHVYAFDATTGALVWESDPLRAASGEGVIVNATVTIGRDFVYQSTYTGFGGTDYVQAFRLSDGSEAWYHAYGGQGQETVVYHEDGERSFIYRMTVNGSYPSGGTGMICLDAQTGAEIWSNAAPLDGSAPWWTADANFGGISFHDGLIFAPTYNFGGVSQFICVDAYTGARKWEAADSVASDGLPIVLGSRVYIAGHYDWFTGPSYLIGYDIATGVKNYEAAVSLGNNMWTLAPAATNDRIYLSEGSRIFGGNANGLHALDPLTGDDLSSPSATSQRVTGSVAIGTDGAIYALMETDPASGLAHLICYRAPRLAAASLADQNGDMPTGKTNARTVDVQLDADWADEVRIWEQGDTPPGTWQAYAASLTFMTSNGDGTKTLNIELRNGAGETQRSAAIVLSTVPELASSQPDLNFTEGSGFEVDVENGETSATLTLTLTNTGGATLNFVGGGVFPGFAIVGSDFSLVSVSPNPAAGLAPGQSLTATVRFAPSATQRTLGLGGELVITTNDPATPELRIELVGDAVPVEVSAFTID